MTRLTEPLPQDLRNRSFRALNCEGWDFSGRDAKQNHKCRDCGRQFVEDPHWKPADRPIDRPLL